MLYDAEISELVVKVVDLFGVCGFVEIDGGGVSVTAEFDGTLSVKFFADSFTEITVEFVGGEGVFFEFGTEIILHFLSVFD